MRGRRGLLEGRTGTIREGERWSIGGGNCIIIDAGGGTLERGRGGALAEGTV